MSIGGEDNEIILNASLSNSPDHSDAIAESSRVFLQKELVKMTSNAVKNGIDDIAARLKQNGTPSSNTKSNGSATTSNSTDPSTISNHTPTMQLSCVECGVTKANSEEMEIHIKTEHLLWLPFQCPMCLAERASDSQMREHLHSSHQRNMSKFIYVDNVSAKRKLQVLMDKAFTLNVRERANATSNNIPSSSTATSPYSPPNHRGINSATSSGRNTSTSNGSAASNAASSAQAAATAIVSHQKEKEKQASMVAADFLKFLDLSGINGDNSGVEQKPQTPSSRNSTGRKRPYVPTSVTEAITTEMIPPSADAFLASLNSMSHAQTPENEENDHLSASFSLDDLNIDSNSTLATLFGGGSKKMKYEDGDGSQDLMEDALDALNPISVLDNVAALFGSAPDRTVEANEAKAKSSGISKKRVLGECSKCQKPVTAGARQMHMFFHLAKDEMIYRFRCKHEGCTVEHYRKDQMENHQSKVHGRIDAEMMEDRSLELFQKCQDLSMELLGTKNGTIPGPTAAKAEIAYAAQQAANAQRVRSRSHGTATMASAATSPPSSSSSPMDSNGNIVALAV